ncbi:MAG TPA: MBL fold metallo-hydrolase [Blastocatellia bacterium]|jgi:glyoxylase-like metal-dependent hydrolase (beta-lactamase superfamily II)|nr:MBL fold metallo-hydrolase [Blastocatellia bacterium]
MKIHRISLPTPFYVGPVNVYLIQEDPLTLIDVGPRSDDTLKALRSGLDRLGHRFSDIKRIVISHAHADHYGLAQLVVEESGAEVLIHAWDAPAVSATSDYAAYRELLAVIGVPREMIEKMEAGYEKFLGFTYPMKRVEPLEDGDEIVFDHESLTVVHTPGHTPGSICLVRSSNRLVFSSDTVLKNITPNPVLSPDPYDETKRFQSLGEYLVSLARIRSLAPTLLKGGHGDDVTDYDEHFNRLYRFTVSRQSKLLSLIPKAGISGWDASRLLFPNASGYNRFLAVSETVAHMDFAVSENRLLIERRDGRDLYRLP